jgi:hypothetical protein
MLSANGRAQEILPSLSLHAEGIAGYTKGIWRPGCVKTIDQSFIMHKTRRQHQQMEDLMACAYEVKTSWKPALRYLLSVSKTAAKKSF